MLWRDGEKLVNLTASSIIEAYGALQKAFYELLVKQARQQGTKTPDDAQVTRALLRIWPQLTDGQKAMLQAHYYAPKRQMTATQLARYWQIINAEGEPTTAGIMKWAKRSDDEHPLPHACMGDLLRFKREEVDRWAQEEAARRKAEGHRKKLQLAS